jgi:predicted nucleic acid-binding protein
LTEIVVLDANVLVPYNLCSLLLALAEADLFEPRWSTHILDETQRTLIRRMNKPADKIARRLDAMREAFPEASVHGFEWMEPGLTCHRKDRHVLAAAIAANATTIVTTNLKDFPDESCAPHGVVAEHPDVFLQMLFGQDAAACAAALEADAARKKRPPMTPQAVLASFAEIAPTFANTMHQHILEGAPPTSDVPAYVAVPVEDSPLADWTDKHDPTNPWHVALAWWTALRDRARYSDVLADLTHSPSAFGDYEWAADLLNDQSIASRVYYAVDDPEHVAFVRFFPEVAESSQTFAAFTVPGGRYMTLCKYADGSWRVWGLGKFVVGARGVRASLGRTGTGARARRSS